MTSSISCTERQHTEPVEQALFLGAVAPLLPPDPKCVQFSWGFWEALRPACGSTGGGQPINSIMDAAHGLTNSITLRRGTGKGLGVVRVLGTDRSCNFRVKKSRGKSLGLNFRVRGIWFRVRKTRAAASEVAARQGF